MERKEGEREERKRGEKGKRERRKGGEKGRRKTKGLAVIIVPGTSSRSNPLPLTPLR